MKLYILRHFERDINDPSFESQLLKIGINNSLKKISTLKNIEINTIISSPFLRCIQSVDLFSKLENININIDYSLCEYFTKIQEQYKKIYIIPIEWYKSFNIINKVNQKYNLEETMEDCIKRVNIFMDDIIQKYKNSDKNILLVTHMTIVNIILNYFDKKHYENIEINFERNYDMGKLLFLYRD